MQIRLLSFLILVSISFVSNAQVRFANIELRAAKQRATIEDKLIFVDTYASYCKPCKQLDIEFKNQKLSKYLNKHFINVKVDMEGKFGQDFKNKYQVVFLPTIMILDKHGNLKFKIDRLASADELLALSKHYQEKLYPETAPAPPIVQAPVATTKPQRETTKSARTTKPKTTTATTKPKIAVDAQIDKTENTVANPEEVIVHVMGQGSTELPPEILKQEAYFRMELMDGSHRSAAHKYLSTQDDWATLENMRFLFDFLYTVNSKEFDYLIQNRVQFDNLIGKDEVDATVNIIVNNELERAYPRPDFEKAKLLYTYLGIEQASNEATEYVLGNLLNEKNEKEYALMAEQYISENQVTNANIYFNLSKILLKSSNSKRELKKIRPYIEKAIELQPNNSSHLLLQSALEYKLDNIKEAKVIADRALSVAKAEGQNVREINEMISRLKSL